MKTKSLNIDNKNVDDKSDFTQGSIIKKLILFMIPILGALILQAAYGAVDLLVVGKFGSTAGLSGVSTGSQVLNLVTFVVTQFSAGITILIGIFLGEKREKRIGRLIGASTIIFTIVSVILFIVMVFFARPLAILLQAPKEAVDLTVTYIRICGSGIFFIVAYNVLSAIFRGLGDSKSPLIFVGVACLVNVVGDLLFVAVFKMNVAGAALATVLAQFVSVIYALYILKKRHLPFTLKRKDFSLNELSMPFIRIGSPLALQEFLTQISFLALAAFVNGLGLEASSGYGVASKVINFAMLIPSALMQSLSSFIAQNVGAKKHKRARKSLAIGIGIGIFFGIIMFSSIWFKGDLLSSAFTNSPQVIEKGYSYLKGFAFETIVTAFVFSMLGYFNGYQKSKWVMTQGLLQTFLVRLPFSYIMSIQPDASLAWIGFAAPLSSIFGLFLNGIYFARLNKKINLSEA